MHLVALWKNNSRIRLVVLEQRTDSNMLGGAANFTRQLASHMTSRTSSRLEPRFLLDLPRTFIDMSSRQGGKLKPLKVTQSVLVLVSDRSVVITGPQERQEGGH